MIEVLKDDKVPPVFKLSEFAKMYLYHLTELGVELPERVNSTRLKERILTAIPNLTVQFEGRDVTLIFQANIGDATKNVLK